MEDNKEFNPFNYRPFLVREWTLEQFEEDNKKLWDEVWAAYQKRAKTPFIPKPTKQDVLNDVRYLLVNASKHHLKQITKKYCNVLADSEALASVAQKLLDDMNSDINIPKLDLSIQGEDPKFIPYIILKSGMSFKFLLQLKEWFRSLDKKDIEKLHDIYNDEEIERLRSLMSYFSHQMACYYRDSFQRARDLFNHKNCLVHDDVFPAFVEQLYNEVIESEAKYKDFVDIYLPLRAAKEAGCFKEIKRQAVEEVFSKSAAAAGKAKSTQDNKFSDLNTKTIENWTPSQQGRLNQLTEVFAHFAPPKPEETSKTDTIA